MNSRTVLLALSALGVCASAQADLFLDLELASYGAGSRQQVSANSNLLYDESTGSETFYNVLATEHVWDNLITGQTGIISHCVEIYQSVSLNEVYEFGVVPLTDVPQTGGSWPGEMGEQRAILVRDLYANYVDPLTGGVYDAGAVTNDYAAAFQVMLWEITHERFTADTASGMAAQIFVDFGAIQWQTNNEDSVGVILEEMKAVLNDGAFASVDVEGWTNPTAQDQSALIPIPGPATLIALGIASPFFGRRRRQS